MLSPFDDLPIHQIAAPVRVVGTSDRNFYDRYYFNLHACREDLFAVFGLGQYPNLGVTDAFVAVTEGSVQQVVRASAELDDRGQPVVGPFSVEVHEGLQRLTFRCDAPEETVEMEVTWEGGIPAHLELPHQNRRGARLITDTARFFQTGRWQGWLRVGDHRVDVVGDEWWGCRDRSWGIRPVGDAEPAGRPSDQPQGFLWLYCQMQFAGSSILYMLGEDRFADRSLEEGVRVWANGDERPPQRLGRPEHELHFVSGTRWVDHATLSFRRLDGPELTIEVTPLANSYLALGTGYGMDRDWRHGMYQGPLVVQSRRYDLGDPETSAGAYGLVDSLARFELDGEVGYGLFEYAVLGPNDRYGFGSRH